MWHSEEPSSRLTSVLWITPLEALSPFYRVPLPPPDRGQKRSECHPGPRHLRFLTLTAFLTNWVAWLSRVETCASLGVSRFSPFFVSTAVAASLLYPFSLGCGQAPLLDMWPLWLLRRLLTVCLRLPRWLPRRPFDGQVQGDGSCHATYPIFPFSDLDEI